MKKNIWTISLIAVLLAGFTSCKKNIDIPPGSCDAGKGGDEIMILQPEHHGVPIPSIPGYPDSAFIKFNATEFPGDDPALYDLIVVGTEGSAEITIENMNCGNYYIFMAGKDQNIDERVVGGVPVVIKPKSGVNIIKVAITES